MATSITIQDIPDDTRDELTARAALAGRSLEEYIRSWLIALARQPHVETPIARTTSRKSATGSELTADEILAYRDENRR